MTLVERLESVSAQIEAILADGKLSIFEVIDTLRILGDCVKETLAEQSTAPTEAELEAKLLEAWAWADGKYKLVDKADEAIKLNVIFEAIDGLMIRYLVEKAGIPALAKKLV